MKLRRRQSGLVMIAIVVVLLLAGAYVFIGSLNASAARVERDRVTRDALLKAKQALIAYAVADANRPGELPCPDVNDDGKLVMGEDYVGSNCVSLIGRLPWSTLELPDLRDEDGERLWYALSNDFHANGSVALNSDTAYRAGNTSLTLTGTQPGTNLVAIVFSPGPALVREGAAAAQQRGCIVGTNCDAAGKCTTSPASNTPKCNPANYLDVTGGVDNADGDTNFISAAKTDRFNDRLLPIYSDDIMWLVERRAGRELAQKLRDHFDAWQTPPAVPNTNFANFKGFYPWAAPLTDPAVVQAGTSPTTNGLLPLSAASVTWQSGVTTLGTGCVGVNTTQIDCSGTVFFVPISITGRVRNVGTAFIDPPSAANVTLVSGIMLGAPVITWTLVPGSNALDFSYNATFLGLTRIIVRAPTASSWTTTSWLVTNDWNEVTQYAVSPGYALTGGGACALPGPPQCVSVNGAAAHAAVVMTGRALPLAAPAQTLRPITTPPNVPAAQYLESVNATPGNLTFVRNLKAVDFNDLPIVVRP